MKDYYESRYYMNELEYFGTSFGCEPMGGLSKNVTLEIVD